jgi:hypothetical protein
VQFRVVLGAAGGGDFLDRDHQLEEDGQRWLPENRHRIELHRLPSYSPEFMAMEGVWKTTRKLTTHNAFFVTPDQRDAKLTETFNLFQRRPKVIAVQGSHPSRLDRVLLLCKCRGMVT